MKTRKKKYSLLLLGLMLFPLNTYALNKTETIYTHLDYQGKKEQTVVSNHLSFIGDTDVQDETELKEILNISGEEKFNMDGNRLTWNPLGKDIYYQGKTDKTMPIETKVTYFLDGKESKLDDIIGKEGHIAIEYHFQNKEKNRVNINGTMETIYTPFITTLGTVIKGKDTKNIEVNNGKIVGTGSRTIVVGFASPGLYSSTKIDEFKSLDMIKIEFDTSSFELGTTYLVSTPKLIEKKDFAFFDKVDSLKNNIDLLQDNALLLETGAKDLEKGAHQLKAGTGSLANNLSTLTKSVKALKEGSVSLNDGLRKINEAIASMELEIDKQASIEDLTKLKNANSKAINTLLTTTGKTFEELTNIYTSYGLSSYTGNDTTLMNVKATYEMIALLNENNRAIDISIETATTMATKINAMLTPLKDNLKALEAGSTTLATGMSQLDLGVQKLYEGALTLDAGSEKLNTGSTTLSQGTTTFKTEGIDKLKNYANTLKTYSDRTEAILNMSKHYNGFTSTNANETIFVSMIDSRR